MMRPGFILIAAIGLLIASCSKKVEPTYRYFEVGITGVQADWRDSSFVVATADTQLINKIITQLAMPVDDRQIVSGELARGNGGYNINGSHSFGWHFKENNWELVDMSAEIYDGRAYSDLDVDPNYWFGQMKRFAPWGSYIKKEIIR